MANKLKVMKQEELAKKLEKLEELIEQFTKLCKQKKLHKTNAKINKSLKSYLLIKKVAKIAKKKILKGQINLIDPSSNMTEDKICYRFRIWDTGKPIKIDVDKWKILRTIHFDSDCAESTIPHTNIHGQINDKGIITKVKDGEYDTFQGKSIWKSNKIKENLEKAGGGEKSFWVYWERPHKNKSSSSKEPCPYKIGSSIEYYTGTRFDGRGGSEKRGIKVLMTSDGTKLRDKLVNDLKLCPNIKKITFFLVIKDVGYEFEYKHVEDYLKELFKDLKKRGLTQDLVVGDISFDRNKDNMIGKTHLQRLRFD